MSDTQKSHYFKIALANLGVFLVLLILGVPWCEGFLAIRRAGTPGVSVSHRLWEKFIKRESGIITAPPAPLDRYILEEKQVKDMIPIIERENSHFGNTPYGRRIDQYSRFTIEENGIISNKRSITGVCVHLRSRLFKSFDPIALNKLGDGNPWSRELDEFVRQYGLRKVRVSTDENGDRRTFPDSTSARVALIVGDSVAFGVLLNDEETLASVLQRQNLSWRFVNASVPGAYLKDNLYRLEERLRLFGPAVEAVIYVHCENDFSDTASPVAIVSGVEGILNNAGITNRVFVNAQYIYSSMPDVVRATTDDPSVVTLESVLKMSKLRNQVNQLAREAGFTLVDTVEIVDQQRAKDGSLFGGFSLYLDHVHWSSLGAMTFANAIQGLATWLSPVVGDEY